MYRNFNFWPLDSMDSDRKYSRILKHLTFVSLLNCQSKRWNRYYTSVKGAACDATGLRIWPFTIPFTLIDRYDTLRQHSTNCRLSGAFSQFWLHDIFGQHDLTDRQFGISTEFDSQTWMHLNIPGKERFAVPHIELFSSIWLTIGRKEMVAVVHSNNEYFLTMSRTFSSKYPTSTSEETTTIRESCDNNLMTRRENALYDVWKKWRWVKAVALGSLKQTDFFILLQTDFERLARLQRIAIQYGIHSISSILVLNMPAYWIRVKKKSNKEHLHLTH